MLRNNYCNYAIIPPFGPWKTPIPLCVDASATCWLLWIILRWTWGCIYLFGIQISFLLEIHPEAGLLGHIGVLWSVSKQRSVFSTVATPTYVPNDTAQGSLLSTSSPVFIFFSSLIVIKWLLKVCEVVAQCGFYWWVTLSIFLHSCGPSVHILLKNVYSGPLPVQFTFCFVLFSSFFGFGELWAFFAVGLFEVLICFRY